MIFFKTELANLSVQLKWKTQKLGRLRMFEQPPYAESECPIHNRCAESAFFSHTNPVRRLTSRANVDWTYCRVVCSPLAGPGSAYRMVSVSLIHRPHPTWVRLRCYCCYWFFARTLMSCRASWRGQDKVLTLQRSSVPTGGISASVSVECQGLQGNETRGKSENGESSQDVSIECEWNKWKNFNARRGDEIKIKFNESV